MLGGSNWRSRHRTVRSTASSLRSLLFTFLTGELCQLLEDVLLAAWLYGFCIMNSCSFLARRKALFCLDGWDETDWISGLRDRPVSHLRLLLVMPSEGRSFLRGSQQAGRTLAFGWSCCENTTRARNVKCARNSWRRRAELGFQTNGEHFQQLL
jgi:hypothetical protein